MTPRTGTDTTDVESVRPATLASAAPLVSRSRHLTPSSASLGGAATRQLGIPGQTFSAGVAYEVPSGQDSDWARAAGRGTGVSFSDARRALVRTFGRAHHCAELSRRAILVIGKLRSSFACSTWLTRLTLPLTLNC
jgi:hypothetical protein